MTDGTSMPDGMEVDDGSASDVHSLPNGTKRGRPPSKYRAALRALFPEWSDRTFARYYRANLQLMLVDRLCGRHRHHPDNVWQAAHDAVVRPNGTMNIKLWADIAEIMLAEVRREAPDLVADYVDDKGFVVYLPPGPLQADDDD